MNATLEVEMAKGKKGPDDKAAKKPAGSVRIKEDLAYKLRIIVEADRMSAADFLDPLIRQAIEANFKRVTAQLKTMADKTDSK